MSSEPALLAAREAYFRAFGDEGPRPFGVTDERLASVLQEAVDRGAPIPRDFDWYSDLPKGAVA